jgi:hypothetical protein
MSRQGGDARKMQSALRSRYRAHMKETDPKQIEKLKQEYVVASFVSLLAFNNAVDSLECSLPRCAFRHHVLTVFSTGHTPG